MQRSCSIGICAALVLAAALPALAAEGRFPIWTQVAIGGPSPSKYILTRNVAAVAGSGSPAIALFGGPGFEHAEIDLNGMTVSGDPGAGGSVIEATGLLSLTIRNGTLAHVPFGGNVIFVTGVQKVIIEDVKINGGVAGIFLDNVQNYTLRRNVIVDTTADGILVSGAASPSPIEGTIEGNQVKDPAGAGIVLLDNHSSVAIRNNRIEGAGGMGMFLDGPGGVSAVIVAENTVQDSGGDGIHIRNGFNGKIYNNVVHRSLGDGIALWAPASGFLILDNVSGSNGINGMHIEATLNHLDRNVLTLNAAAGLWFGPASASNTYGRNTARGNGPPVGACAVAPVVVCTAPAAASIPPNFCNDGPGNTSFCDNLMPGPPRG